jgi:hypothetical protein
VAKELASNVVRLLAKELGKDEEWVEKQIQAFHELTKQYIIQ